MRNIFLIVSILFIAGCTATYPGPLKYECTDKTVDVRSAMITNCLSGIKKNVDPCDRPNAEELIKRCEELSVRAHCREIKTFYSAECKTCTRSKGPILDCNTAISYAEERVCGLYRGPQ